MTFFLYLQSFGQGYLVPFIFAIGLIFLIYGIIMYYILGSSDEPTKEAGRVYVIKTLAWFLAGTALYYLIVLATISVAWVSGFVIVDGQLETRVLEVPNVPSAN